jgi:hypothetical protein
MIITGPRRRRYMMSCRTGHPGHPAAGPRWSVGSGDGAVPNRATHCIGSVSRSVIYLQNSHSASPRQLRSAKARSSRTVRRWVNHRPIEQLPATTTERHNMRDDSHCPLSVSDRSGRQPLRSPAVRHRAELRFLPHSSRSTAARTVGRTHDLLNRGFEPPFQRMAEASRTSQRR